jgi:hypothetical protein
MPRGGGIRRRAFHDRGADRAFRQIELKWRGRVDRHARVVGDIEQIEHLGRFFDRLDHDARFGARG